MRAGEVIPVIRKLTSAGIPVVAHLGLLPQSAGVLGGYKVQGKQLNATLLEEAKQCEALEHVQSCWNVSLIS